MQCLFIQKEAYTNKRGYINKRALQKHHYAKQIEIKLDEIKGMNKSSGAKPGLQSNKGNCHGFVTGIEVRLRLINKERGIFMIQR